MKYFSQLRVSFALEKPVSNLANLTLLFSSLLIKSFIGSVLNIIKVGIIRPLALTLAINVVDSRLVILLIFNYRRKPVNFFPKITFPIRKFTLYFVRSLSIITFTRPPAI